MLLLAGISISSIVGDNGIINKANKAKDETARAEVKEKLEMKVLNAQIEKSKKRRAINKSRCSRRNKESRRNNL